MPGVNRSELALCPLIFRGSGSFVVDNRGCGRCRFSSPLGDAIRGCGGDVTTFAVAEALVPNFCRNSLCMNSCNIHSAAEKSSRRHRRHPRHKLPPPSSPHPPPRYSLSVSSLSHSLSLIVVFCGAVLLIPAVVVLVFFVVSVMMSSSSCFWSTSSQCSSS